MAVPDDRSEPQEHPASHASFAKVLHYVVAAALVLGGLAYWILKPSHTNPMADRGAAEAMALVQTHRARHAPTLRQAIDERVKKMKDERKGVRPGEWRVELERPETYLVRTIIREEGTRTWFEREYLWRVNLTTRTVEAITMPAEDVMPEEQPTDGQGPVTESFPSLRVPTP
jgi:hypothetical protein